MDGVTVLNVIPPISIWYGGIGICIALIGALVIVFSWGEDMPPITVIGTILMGIGAGVFLASFSHRASSEQYEVIISDDVPLDEFLQRYEIIEQRGEIFTVIEREQNEQT